MAAGKQKEVGKSVSSKPFAARLGASASDLAWSAFTYPPTTTDALASLPDDHNKVAASSSASRLAQGPGADTAQLEKPQSTRRPAVKETFRQRSNWTDRDIQNDFNKFVDSQPKLDESTKWPILYDETSFEPNDRGIELPFIGRAHEDVNDLWRSGDDIGMEQANGDGAAVVQLLSRPGNPSEGTPPANWNQQTDGESTARSTNNLLDGPNQLHTGADVLNDRKLMDMVTFLESHGVDMARYHNEVWGDHLLHVEEAYEEVQQGKGDPNTTINERPAVHRLRMLLQHLDPHPRK
ncbi:uncharacterized protein KY384_004192 [Bacidia gigantensis]|uniref:uncharacterized protein n=1 Tax=Bacidia gigantensis TaxID=2732470 RepID=UPI001D04E734|nr:uncharacterized protein KY384_004192 [Bacidia gigantensis]KAG8530835.1 hypothetical protein KY384_004192 [Bacidia gigantensis]